MGNNILKITLRKLVITMPASSNCEFIFDKALPVISIDNGVKMVVSTNITPTYEDVKFVLSKRRKKKSFQATAKIYGEMNKGINRAILKNRLNAIFVL